jgi:hypothetical protein
MEALRKHVGQAPLIYAAVLVLVVVAAGTLAFTTRAACASKDPYATGLVITPENHGCTYRLLVGQSFEVRLDPTPDAYMYWPVALSDETLVSNLGAMVGSPSGVHEAFYRAVRPGKLRVEHFDVTIRIEN